MDMFANAFKVPLSINIWALRMLHGGLPIYIRILPSICQSVLSHAWSSVYFPNYRLAIDTDTKGFRLTNNGTMPPRISSVKQLVIYSRDQGCKHATNHLYGVFASLGLWAEVSSLASSRDSVVI